MNIFRLAGDLAHLLSILVLLLKITGMRSCRGISLKTQELYLLVFVTRYLDIFTSFVSLYNTFMKLVFLTTSGSIIYFMRVHPGIKLTYDREQDTFRHQLIAIPCIILALATTEKYTLSEVLWTFSILLEAVAILPQLVLLQRTQNIDNLTGNYVFLLGTYRALYIINWVYRYANESHYRHESHWLEWVCGLLQTGLYIDFFYYYVKSWKNNEKLALPA